MKSYTHFRISSSPSRHPRQLELNTTFASVLRMIRPTRNAMWGSMPMTPRYRAVVLAQFTTPSMSRNNTIISCSDDFPLLDFERVRLRIGTRERRLDGEGFEAHDLVVLRRGERLIALRAVDDNGVDLRPEELDDLFDLVLLAEPVPPNPAE